MRDLRGQEPIKLGRQPVSGKIEERIRALRVDGLGVLKTGRRWIGTGAARARCLDGQR